MRRIRIHKYSKEFADLNAALAFGKEVDFVNQQDGAWIPTGKKRNRLSCYLGRIVMPEEFKSEYEHVGTCHLIKKDPGRDVYHVQYGIGGRSDYSPADEIKAERFVTEYLDQKYKELNPNAGISLKVR